ncbi:MAG: tyrosine-type recombinase/integrase [Firmicutes bacterium]|nr:tyrosine-type recombinase/integrase [Bacillota bacterium]
MDTTAYTVYLEKMGKSRNTILAYCKDIEIFAKEIGGAGAEKDLATVTNTEIVSYVLRLKNDGASASTINRKLSSLRTYFYFLLAQGRITEDPTVGIKAPKVSEREIEFLSMDEVDRLMQAPDDSVKGLRDRAILELMYATGIRASELIEIKLADVNTRMGMLVCQSKARVIPFGKPARLALEEYIEHSRDIILGEGESEFLFLNYNGTPLSRQGLWKILKDYAGKSEIEGPFTPKTLRNSFAVHMLQNGADLKTVQKLMGHDDISATEVYLSATSQRIKDVYDKTHPRA